MRAGDLVVALLETGFNVRGADAMSVIAIREVPRILLNATARSDGAWSVRTTAARGLPGVSAVLRRPYDVISLLSAAYDLPTTSTP